MKRMIFAILLVALLASITIPVEAAGGPRDRSHPHSGSLQVTCVSQSAQEAAYAWMNELRNLDSTAPGYKQWRQERIARFRRETLRLARTEPAWFRTRVRKAARLQDRGRKQAAIGQLWKAVEVNCR